MVVLVIISGNELILGMSLMKLLKRIGPTIDHWGTPYKFDFASDMIKLQHNGIRGVMLSWLKSYLRNRKQYVSVKN